MPGDVLGDRIAQVDLGIGQILFRQPFAQMAHGIRELFAPGARRKSDFFRDIAGSRYLAIGEQVAKDAGLRYDFLLNVFDRSIIEVENRIYGESISKNLRAPRKPKVLPPGHRTDASATGAARASCSTAARRR